MNDKKIADILTAEEFPRLKKKFGMLVEVVRVDSFQMYSGEQMRRARISFEFWMGRTCVVIFEKWGLVKCSA